MSFSRALIPRSIQSQTVNFLPETSISLKPFPTQSHSQKVYSGAWAKGTWCYTCIPIRKINARDIGNSRDRWFGISVFGIKTQCTGITRIINKIILNRNSTIGMVSFKTYVCRPLYQELNQKSILIYIFNQWEVIEGSLMTNIICVILPPQTSV